MSSLTIHPDCYFFHDLWAAASGINELELQIASFIAGNAPLLFRINDTPPLFSMIEFFNPILEKNNQGRLIAQ
jgi:hypothetical protein